MKRCPNGSAKGRKRCPPKSSIHGIGDVVAVLENGKECRKTTMNIPSSKQSMGTYSVVLSKSYNNRYKLRKSLKKKFAPSMIISKKVLSNRVTASGSKVTKLDLKGNRSIVIKESRYDESLLNEANIYRMINNLVYKKVCPFFFTSVRLPEIEIVNGKKQITQYMETDTILGNFSSISKKASMMQLKGLLFQLWYGLTCLHQLGIAHRDMHFENVYVVQSKHAAIKYITHHGTFYVPTYGYEVRIYDFDRSFKSNMETNSQWNKISKVVIPDLWTHKYGSEKKHQYRFDIFKLVYYMTFRQMKLLPYNITLKHYPDSLGRTADRKYPKIKMASMFKIYETPIPTTYTCNMMKLSPSDKMYN